MEEIYDAVRADDYHLRNSLLNSGKYTTWEDDDDITPLMLAARLNHVNCIRTWTQYFALHSSKKYRHAIRTGETALMVAASKGNIGSIRALILEARAKDS